MIRFVLNVLWLIFGGGLVLFLGYALAAVICFVLVVTIPFAVASWRLAVYSLWPFGRTVRAKSGGSGVVTGLANVLWVVLAGWWLALTHITAGIGLCATLIGIPFGIAHFKLVPAAFWPLGREIADLD
ncbi:YccF domain-containing protein [Dactylosporangium sp. NPDC000555]|uniref:YccF domain-containing protein n=1 Tax=Dactylosporangium sp. NPDC000555 TaxID=3154260 RepID=UPI003317973B